MYVIGGKPGETSDTQLSQMLEESVKMKDFDHPNILSLIGVCIATGSSPYIVMPFMANGSLLSYLKQQRHKLTIANGAEQDLVSSNTAQRFRVGLRICNTRVYGRGKGVTVPCLTGQTCQKTIRQPMHASSGMDTAQVSNR